uniref:Probable terpene synthase 2 n=1 Tax=Nicotiana sylvestris TaxID=4096 RepID=A0A1U7YN14_NICSY|nr:PREDICTED: probable terpene synthase 2 [Nicotiana sylvestris]
MTELKYKVKTNLDLINAIKCLGVAHHFEHEIEKSLAYICTCYEELNGESDLHVVVLRFRLLRQHGYYVSADVFWKFTNNKGNYKKALVSDVQGLLSLYEATQFRVHSEEILGEAVNFTTTHLKLLLPTLSNSLAMKISNALKYPINYTMVIVATRKYISFYQEDKARDDVLLNFAKLDYNILQKMHKSDLKARMNLKEILRQSALYLICLNNIYKRKARYRCQMRKDTLKGCNSCSGFCGNT